MEKFRQMACNQILRSQGILVHAAQNFCVDVSLAYNFQRRGGDGFFPFGHAFAEAKIGIEKVAARPQYARNLRQKSGKVWITMRGLDIDDRVESAWIKG